MPEESLAGKTALITGAGTRIGRAIALALAAEGVHIVIHFHRSRREARKLACEIEAGGVRSWLLSADFSRRSDHESVIDSAWDASGGFQFLVNSASIFTPSRPQKLTDDDLHRNLQVNAWVPFLLSRAFFQKAPGGKIVNLLDTRIQRLDRGHTAYWLSKLLLHHFTRLSALEFAPHFSVNAVAPGLILPPPGEDESYLKKRQRKVPLRRHGDPADIAASVLFLLKSSFITGQVIYVDGGAGLTEA